MLIKRDIKKRETFVQSYSDQSLYPGHRGKKLWGVYWKDTKHLLKGGFKTEADALGFCERTNRAYALAAGEKVEPTPEEIEQEIEEAKAKELSEDEKENGPVIERNGFKVRINNRKDFQNISEEALFISKYGRDVYLGLPYK